MVQSFVYTINRNKNAEREVPIWSAATGGSDRGQLLSIGEMAGANRVSIATLIDEDMATWERGTIEVITDDSTRAGQTVLHPSEEGVCRVATVVDHDRYDAVIGGMLRRLHPENGSN